MGFLDQTVKTFRVYNQPLFAYPDTSDMSGAIVYSVLKDEDMATHMQRAMFSNMNMGHLRRFNRMLERGDYSPGYPDVGINFNINENSAVQSAVDDSYGRPMDIWYTNAGKFTPNTWIMYQLYNDNHVQNDFIVASSSSVEEVLPNTVLVNLGGPGVINNARFNSDGVAIVTITYIDHLDEEVTDDFETDIGPITTTDSHYIVSVGYTDYGGDSQVSDSLFDIWAYNVNDGTYPDLTLSDFHFGSTVGYTECFPAVPVRVKNVNFTDPVSGLDSDGIVDLLGKFGIKPDLIIDEMADDPSVDMSKMDNIFINFGVRIWDESEAGRQYLYTFFSTVLGYLIETETANDEIDCVQDSGDEYSEEIGEFVADPSCHSITVNTEETDFEFFFSTIRNTFYTLAEVNADPDLSQIYYSDTGVFHSSSGEFLRPAGYTAMSADDIDNWLDGHGVKSARQIPYDDLGWNWLKPAVVISSWTGVIYDWDGTISLEETLIPERVYVGYLGGVRIIRPEPLEDIREVTYYAILPNGMDAITVYGIGAQVLVQDTEFPDEKRFIKLSARMTNGLTVPFMFGIVENIYDIGQMHDKVDALVASMHATVYVADVSTVELPWWVVLIKVIAFVIAVVLIYLQVTAPVGMKLMGVVIAAEVGLEAVVVALLIGAVLYLVSTVIFGILRGNPWAQLGIAIVGIAIGYYSGGFQLATMKLTDLLLKILDIISTITKTITSFNVESQKDEFDLIQDTYIEEINDLRMLETKSGIGKYSDITTEALYGESELTHDPIEPARYYEKFDNIHNIGFMFYDYDGMYAYA